MIPKSASEEYPLSQSAVDEYRKNGHTLLCNVVPVSEIAELRNAVRKAHDALLTEKDRHPAMTTYDKAFRLTENLWEINDVVRAHVACLQALLQNFLVVATFEFTTTSPSSKKAAERDQMIPRRPLDTDKCGTLWIPLIDCPVEMGPVSFVSGSHKNREAEHLEISDESDELIRKLIDEQKLAVAHSRV